ncbi:MAG: ferritin-like domain-containing protein [Gammaproteobacteria bacterium]|nr:ferritin-like domain-containing protein [Gammaproteobacteria bacterium]
MKNLHTAAYHCLTEQNLEQKLLLATKLNDDLLAGNLAIKAIDLPPVELAGRPEKPQLVHPREVAKRKLGTDKGKAAAIHSFCHIEFNAINLACDAVYRFQDMPEQYYGDWSKVAAEEAYHFSLLQERLQELDYSYGDFPAHNGLWELAQKTAGDVLDRMALIPRVMEARGLDVTPMIQKKFRNVGDQKTVDILDIILRDEISHVQAGSRWFLYVCQQRGLDDPEQTYLELVKKYMKGDVHCPMHFQARLDAGFSESELEQLMLLCGRH